MIIEYSMIKCSKIFFTLINQVTSHRENVSEHIIVVTNIKGNFCFF